MLTLRDISHLKRLAKQEQELQIFEMVTSSVTHNMITPLKSISSLSKRIYESLCFTSGRKDSLKIYNNSQILLSEVKLLLDKNLLDNKKFQSIFSGHPVNDTIQTAIDILQLQAEHHKVQIHFLKLP
jgi:K+-sensing histidine kinase KdpD